MTKQDRARVETTYSSTLADALKRNSKGEAVLAIKQMIDHGPSTATAWSICNVFMNLYGGMSPYKPPLYTEPHEEPTMADMLYSAVKSGKTTYEELAEPAALHNADSTEYDVIVWKDSKPHVYRYYNKQEAYEAAKNEHMENNRNTVYVSRIIAQPYTTTEMEEFE